MTTLIKDPVSGGFQLPNDPKTTSPITIKPSLASLVPNPPIPTPLPTPASVPISTNPTTSFTTALIGILRDAQQRNQTGQESLLKQGQGITGLGLNDATRNFANPNLTPSAGTSLGNSAQNEFDPLTLSIENQQKLATQGLGDMKSLVDATSTAYEKEQDRIQSEKDKKDALAAKPKNFDTDANIAEVAQRMQKITGKAKGEKNGDNYIDPNAWIAMRNLWQSHGGSDATFVSNFKRYVNPLSYDLVGIGTGDSGA